MDLPQLGFGGAPIGGLLDPVDDTAAIRTVDAALDAGIRYFDTAPYYGFGLSEHRLGKALRDRTDAIVSTKVGRLLKPGLPPDPLIYGWPKPLPFHPVYDYSYDGVMRSFEDSLQRMGRDRIDILYIHDIDRFTHGDTEDQAGYFNDAMTGGYRALEELKRAGCVQAIGIGVNEIQVCLETLEHGDWDVFLLAGRYTLLEQAAHESLLAKCAAQGVRIVIGGPFNSGILAGGATWNYAEAPPDIRDRVAGLRRVCEAHGVALAAAAVQFPLAHPTVASVIPGIRTPGEFAELLDFHRAPIPAGLWSDLKTENLLHPDVPTPA